MVPAPARFTLDLDAFTEGMVKGTAATMRGAQMRFAAFGLAFLALGALSVVALGFHTSLTWTLWLGCGIACFGLAGLRPMLYRRQLRQVLAGRADLDRTVDVRLTEADLTIHIEGVRTTTQRLGVLAGVQSYDDGVLVELLVREFLWIPASAFLDATERERFVRHILARAPLPDAAL